MQSGPVACVVSSLSDRQGTVPKLAGGQLISENSIITALRPSRDPSLLHYLGNRWAPCGKCGLISCGGIIAGTKTLICICFALELSGELFALYLEKSYCAMMLRARGLTLSLQRPKSFRSTAVNRATRK